MSCFFKSFLLLCFIFQAVICAAQPVLPAAKVAADFKSLLAISPVSIKPELTLVYTDSMLVETGRVYAGTVAIPVLIYKPLSSATKRFPVVICHHGTGGNKEQADIRLMMSRLVKSGFMAVSMDARYHGARIAGGAHGKKEYEAAIIRAWQTKTDDKQDYPFYYDTAGDTYHLVDYLCQRPDVDSSRIGMTGISMGGIETYMEAAVDKRVKVAVPVIAAQSFKWSLENNRWKGRVATIQEAHSEVARALGDSSVNPKNITALWNKVVPGITGEFDCPSLIRALAPRPLLLLSAESDQNCPLPGAKIAFDAAREAYATSGASDKLKIDVAPNEPHRFTPAHLEQLIAWFEKWL